MLVLIVDAIAATSSDAHAGSLQKTLGGGSLLRDHAAIGARVIHPTLPYRECAAMGSPSSHLRGRHIADLEGVRGVAAVGVDPVVTTSISPRFQNLRQLPGSR